MLNELWEADALLTGLIVRSGAARAAHTIFNITHPFMYGLDVGVQVMAEKTGGDFIQAGEPGAAFQEAMRRIRTRYSLYYAAPADAKAGARRVVRTQLSPGAARRYPQARVRARTGYIAAALN